MLLGFVLFLSTFQASVGASLNDIEDSYAKNQIHYLYQKEIVYSKDGKKFDPKEKITREEFASIIANVLRKQNKLPKADKKASFEDVSTLYKEDVSDLFESGYLYGYTPLRFGAKDPITREQAAVFYVRAMGLEREVYQKKLRSNFYDHYTFSSWSKPAVSFLERINFVRGVDEHRFSPKDTVERQAVAALSYRLLDPENTDPALNNGSVKENKYMKQGEILLGITIEPDKKQPESPNEEEMDEELPEPVVPVPVGQNPAGEPIGDKPVEEPSEEPVEEEPNQEPIEEKPTEEPVEEEPAEEESATEKLNQLYADKTFFLEHVLAYESPFKENSYSGLIDEEEAFKTIEGSIPVLVSAPHSTSQIREGSEKVADTYTGSIALLLNELTDVYVIYSNKRTNQDPNYIIGGAYKEEMERLIETHDIHYVLDLHGAARSRSFDVDLGTDYGNSINEETLALINDHFNENNILDVRENDTFAASSDGTITNYTYKNTDAEAVQLELHKRLRDPRNDIDAFYQNIRALVGIVGALNNSSYAYK